jgi:hypothetical protein
MSFLQSLEKRYAECQAGVYKARSVKKRDEPQEAPKGSSQFAALQTTLSSKIVADLFKKIKSKGNLSSKDLQALANVSPKILGALLLDMRVLTKAKQASFVRKLSEAMLKK